MAEKNLTPPEPEDGLIDNAVSAIRNAVVPPMPPGLKHSTVAKMVAAAGQSKVSLFYERIRAMKPRNKLVAAASFLIAAAGVATLVAVMTARPNSAFADVKEQFQNAKTIQMTLSYPTPGPAFPVELRIKEYIKEPDLLRTEMEDGAVITIDVKARKMLILDPHEKEAMLMDVGELPDEFSQSHKMLDAIRKCLKGSPKAIGERKIDGKPAEGFRVEKDSYRMELWVDKAGGNVTMIKLNSLLPNTPIPQIIIRDIVLDKEMPDSLFSLKPPEGYKLTEQKMDLSNPVEADLATGLKMLATSMDGKFPDNLTPGAELGNQAERAAEGKPEAEQQAMMQQFARMVVFVSLKGQAQNFQYAGKGVKLGDANTPVGWWRKDAGKDYRVLFGDLSLKDMPADKLPARATQPTTAPGTLPAGTQGLVRVQIIDKAGSNMGVGLLKPPVVLRIEKNASAKPAETWTKGVGEFSGPTSKPTNDLVIRIDDPRGQRANLFVSGPVKISVYDYEAATLATLDSLSAGITLTVKPKPAAEKAENPELAVELRDAEGKTKDVTAGR